MKWNLTKMLANKSKGRDTTSFQANVTASLKVCEKKALANESNLLLELVKNSGMAAYQYGMKPLIEAAKPKVYASLSMPLPTLTEDNTPLSKEAITQRQLDADLSSFQLNEKFEILESKIIILLSEKKQIDAKEKDNKTKGVTPLLQQNEMKRRLFLLESIDDLLFEKVELSKGHIQEHAIKRLDIMFLLMLTLYKKNVTVTRGKTDRQHGKGSKKTGTAACHASLLPHPELEPIINHQPLKTSRFFHFFSTPEKIEKISSEKIKSLYIYDVCNLTNELSTIVNEFDGHLEGKWIKSNAVQASINLLNKVASGAINPIEGINQFAGVMTTFFTHIEYRYIMPKLSYNPSSLVQSPKAFKKVWEYQRQATLSMFDIHTKNSSDLSIEVKVKPDYLHLMLDLKQLTIANKITSYIYSGPIENRILEIQQEIWNSPSDYSAKLK